MKTYDVIIIGSGPAGCMAAKQSAEAGLSTLLVEKEKIPREKPCGGGISAKALRLVGNIPQELIHYNLKGFQFTSPGSESYTFRTNNSVGVSLFRSEFDAYLAQLAVSAGAVFKDSTRLLGMDRSSQLIKCNFKNCDSVTGKIVIGADGANSTVARLAGIRTKWNPKQAGVAVEGYANLSESQTQILSGSCDQLALYFLGFPFGYGWVFPKRGGASIGLGGMMSELKSPRILLQRFVQYLHKVSGIEIKLANIAGHVIPAGGFKRTLVSERIMLCGDAAGFVDAFTGEGVYYAMKSGIIAAKTAINSIDKDMYTVEKMNEYKKTCEKSFVRDLEFALFLSLRFSKYFGRLLPLLDSFNVSSDIVEALAIRENGYMNLQRLIIWKSPKVFPKLASFLGKHLKERL